MRDAAGFKLRVSQTTLHHLSGNSSSPIPAWNTPGVEYTCMRKKQITQSKLCFFALVLFLSESWMTPCIYCAQMQTKPSQFGELQLYIHTDWCCQAVTHFKTPAALRGLLSCQDSTLKTSNWRPLIVSLRGRKTDSDVLPDSPVLKQPSRSGQAALGLGRCSD